MEELLSALKNNYEGNERLRQMVINRVSKFGNDDPYVDGICSQLLAEIAAQTAEIQKGLQGEYGVITDIQRYSVHDGPGIRTLVFLKGCPMSCIWCQNPESNSIHKELMYREEKCIFCGACVKSCDKNAVLLEKGRITINREKCDLCGKCVDSCYAGSLKIIGRVVSVQEVVEEVMKDEVFYRHSGGGITLSGGEVTFQHKFAAKILEEVKGKGINTAIETAGFCSWEVMEEVIRNTDFVLFDIKHLDDEMHKKYTGSVLDALELCSTIDDDLHDADRKIGKKTYGAAADIGGSWAGSALGAKGGAWAGAAIGTAIFPGVGTAVGGIAGGLILGVAGSFAGSSLGKWVVDITEIGE